MVPERNLINSSQIPSCCIKQMKSLTRKILSVLFLGCLFLLAPAAAGADISVSLSMDRKEATLAESVKLVVSVSGVRDSDSQPLIKGLEHFDVSAGGTSSRVQIINGKMDAGVDFTYYIQPQKTGTFQLGPAEIKKAGKIFRSNAAILKVSQHADSEGLDEGPLFLQARLSSSKAYVGEQIIYTLRLFRQVKVSSVSLSLPKTQRLVFKQLGEPSEYQSVLHGNTYQVLEVRYALVPSDEGQYALEPSRMGMTVYEPQDRTRRGLFDDPFFSFSRGKPISLTSDALELAVLALPELGRPAEFSGLVGTFQIDAGLVPSEIKAGESATLTVHITGRGNVNRIPDLDVPELSHTKVYADQPVLEVNPDSEGLFGSKTMKWALVPEKPGRFQIPALSVSFFDTKSHQYVRTQTSPFFLSVLPGEEKPAQLSLQTGQENKATNGRGKQEVTTLGQDILPIHTSMTDLTSSHHRLPSKEVLGTLLISPCLVFTMFFFATRFKKRSRSTLAATKAKKAAKVLAKKCHEGRLPANEFSLAVMDYFNDRFGLSLGSLTPEEAVGLLTSEGVGTDTADRLKNVLQKMEGAVYTGKGTDHCDVEEDMSALIRAIEKEIR